MSAYGDAFSFDAEIIYQRCYGRKRERIGVEYERSISYGSSG